MDNEEEIPIHINNVELDELIITIGGALFSGAKMSEIDTPILNQLENLIKAEIIIRENNMQPVPQGEALH